MLPSEINGSFISNLFSTSENLTNTTGNSSFSFQKDLQNRIDNNSTKTSPAKETKPQTKEANKETSEATQVPQTIEHKQPTEELKIIQLETTIDPHPVKEKIIFLNKENLVAKDIKNILKKLASLLSQLETIDENSLESLENILTSLDALLLTELTDLSSIASKLQQLQLTDPRTKENLPINLLTKSDMTKLIEKITKNIDKNFLPANINQETEITDLKMKIAHLLDKLNGTIDSSKKDTQLVSPLLPLEESKISEQKPHSIINTIKLETKLEEKEQNKQLLENPEEILIDKTATKKPINNKNDHTLGNQPNKDENSPISLKSFSSENNFSEITSKFNLKEISNTELNNTNLTQQANHNLEKQAQVMNQFRTFITLNKLKTDTEVNMRLYPQELGEIKIKITKEQIAGNENSQIVAKFQVSSQAVKAILESNLDALRNELNQNSNILVSELSVEVEDKNNQKGFSEQFTRNNTPKTIIKDTHLDNIAISENILTNNEINSLA